MVSLMGVTQARQGLIHSSIRGRGIEIKNTLISSQIRSCKTGLTFSLDTAPSKRLTHCNAPVVKYPNQTSAYLLLGRPERIDARHETRMAGRSALDWRPVTLKGPNPGPDVKPTSVASIEKSWSSLHKLFLSDKSLGIWD